MAFESMKFSKSARMVAELSRVKPGENVCLVVDTGMLSMAPAVAEACAAAGGEIVICLMSPRLMPGNSPPPMVASAMKAAQVVILLTSKNMAHTRAASDAHEAGVRIVNLRQMTDDLFTSDVLTPDYRKMYEETSRVVELLDKASEVKIASALGTNISMSVAGRAALCNSGPLDPGDLLTLPSGEAAIAPVEGTAEGVLVVDHAIDGIGMLSSPVKVVAREGKAVSVVGGKEATRFLDVLSQAGEKAFFISEFAIGTNPNSRLIGNVAEDKKKRGSVHVAVGDNHLLGGTIHCPIHLDMVVLKPDVWIDGRQIIKQGEFRLG